ncbi:MAG: sulfoxide reductase heme-binding subunit YedZ [Gammaproteobacteria bacterium]|nr:sulfoxide reductase heme-binding subunit YedZ [Gammaproteobacteria bacterium]MDH3904180.1 sulfoxide reductase heme-binding subunit YedZ [Gammaproteobacteria bacterium]MDH3908312.1 sulfoxide reductase heme-binding subunit YedZ [Gammaproteobacteria bacterium]MDH4003382.1 sulfoxide reductase heme-binding subunit YedZ [Gammaproteobacteria bacterium]
MDTLKQIRFVWKPVVFLLCLVPALLLLGDTFEITGALGANPVEEIQDRLGNWGLRFILIALAVTPLRRITGWNGLQRFRRMLGLYAFFYTLLHFLAWLFLDQGMLLSAILEDIVKRPFITIGFAALLILTAMAATSTNGMRRRLGRRWQQLHYGAYVVGILGVWHYWWQVKKDIREPLIYAVILALLLGLRLWFRYRKSSQRQRKPKHTETLETRSGKP